MITALIGLLGIVIGLLASEWFRRRGRVEIYAEKLFERRLDRYEHLYALVIGADSLCRELVRSQERSIEEQRSAWSEMFSGVAAFLEEQSMYIDEDVQVQCMVAVSGLLALIIAEGVEELDEADAEVTWEMGQLRKLLRQAAGVVAIERTFRRITRTKVTSPTIEDFRRARAEVERGGPQAILHMGRLDKARRGPRPSDDPQQP